MGWVWGLNELILNSFKCFCARHSFKHINELSTFKHLNELILNSFKCLKDCLAHSKCSLGFGYPCGCCYCCYGGLNVRSFQGLNYAATQCLLHGWWFISFHPHNNTALLESFSRWGNLGKHWAIPPASLCTTLNFFMFLNNTIWLNTTSQ